MQQLLHRSILFLLFIAVSAQAYAQKPAPNALSFDAHLQRHVLQPSGKTQLFAFQNLLVGETYALTIPQDLTNSPCLPTFQLNEQTAEMIGYDAARRELRFRATSTTASFTAAYDCAWDVKNPPQNHLSVVCLSCHKTFKEYVQSQAAGQAESMAVLEVGGGQSAEDLVRDVFIGGNCFDVTGVSFTGGGNQIGTFSNGLTNVGFATGMMMATGDIGIAPGPNNNDGAGTGGGGGGGDADLASIASGSLNDVCVIEFDFTPTQTPLTFEYVFASEEYCEYVNSQFNDVFGFFISGAGIPGTQNLAVVPMTTTPITINSINHLLNTGYYRHNTGPGGTNCGINPSNLPAVNELQYDGYTTKFIAVANVIPCSTYHIKLAIADVGDAAFDSAVFLKSGSFDGGGNASVEWVVNNDPDDEDVYEGCGTVQLVFDRVGTNPSLPVNVSYTIGGTATMGIDYSNIPSSVTIPAGQDQFILNVNILTDALTEGEETVFIKLSNPCSCLNPEETLIIIDLPVLNAIADTVTICGPGVAVVGSTPLGGVEPYTYAWNTGSTDPTTSVFASISTTYTVTITDACGRTKVARARVKVNSPPNGQMLPPAPQICPGQSANITINFNGNGPFEIQYNLNGDAQSPIGGITDDPYTLVINQPGLYQLTAVTDSAGCQGAGQGVVLVTASTLNLVGLVTDVKCFGQSNGSINTTATGGQGPMNYAWTGPSTIGNIPDPLNILAGTYTVILTDFWGCSTEQTYTVQEPPAIAPTIVSALGPNCLNPTGGSINLEVTGGNPAYQYKWTGGQTVQDPTGLAQGTYTVTITDSKGCMRTTTASIVGNFTPPAAIANAPSTLTCANTSVTLDGTGSSSGTGYSYNWIPPAGGSIASGQGTLNPVVNQPGAYTLVVTNAANGCTQSATATVQSTISYPTADAGNNQTITCVLSNVTLNGAGSSQGSNFTYLWGATNGGNISAGETTLNPVATLPGTYTLTVTNSSNGCTSTDVAVVNTNTTNPNAAISTPPLLTCTNTTVSLSGTGSTPAGSLSYTWSTTNGNIQSGQGSSSIVASEPGTYTLVVTNNANGCTDDAAMQVNQDNSIPVANANAPGGLDCNTTQVTINGSGTSTGANFTFQWSSSTGSGFVGPSNVLSPTVNAAGTYTLLVTNTANSCTTSASVVIPQNTTPPLANAGQPATLNCVNTTLVLGDPNASTANNLTYAWTGTGITAGANTPTPTVSQPGPFTLVVTDATNGCKSTATVNIAQNIQAPVATVANANQINCTTPAVQLNGNGSSSGPLFTYEWMSSTGGGIGAGGSTLTPTVTAAGTYTLIVTNSANGCTSTASTPVSTNANLPTAVAQPLDVIDCNVPSVTVVSTGSSSGANFAYAWGTINGQIVSGQGTSSIVAGLPGQYTLLVTNTTNNCTATFAVTVDSDLAPPVADAGNAQTLNCTVPSLAIDGSGSASGSNITYQWTASPGGVFTTATNIASPQVSEAGTYTVLVTNTANGCTSTDQVIITADANDPVVAIATPATLTCATQQTVLNSAGSSTGGDFTYNWSGPGLLTPATATNASINAPGTYGLTISNTANGCTSTASVVVAQNIAPPVADAGLDNILNCYTPQLQIGGTNTSTGANFTYNWSGAGIVGSNTVVSPIISAGGNYTLLVTNTQNGCTTTDLVAIATDFAAPQAAAGPGFQLTCVQNTYTMGATASSGANFTYSWGTTGGNFTSPTNILTPTVNGAGQYYLTVTNTTNGCTSTSDVQITQAADVPVALANLPGILTCAAVTINLSGNGSSTGTDFSYLWTTQDGNIVTGNTGLSPTINEPGTYSLQVTNTANNCTSTSSVIVSQDIAPPVIDAGAIPTLTCTVLMANLAGTVSSNGNFVYAWQAQGGGNILSGGNTLAPTAGAPGIYVLTVTNQNNGCSSTDETQVLQDIEDPVVSIAEPKTLTCTVLETELDATATGNADLQYAWTATNGGTLVQQVDPLQPLATTPGTYTLLVTNQGNGCSSTAVAVVTEDVVLPTANAGVNGLLTCDKTTVVLDGTGSSQNGDYFYQWSSANGQILVGGNTLTPTVVTGGIYQLVVVNNENGCTRTDEATVTVDTLAPAVAIAAPGIITCVQPTVTLNGAGSQGGANISYAWSTLNGNIQSGSTSNSAVVNASGTYMLSVKNNTNGCVASKEVNVGDNIVLPVADAGPPATLTCTVLQLGLLGSGSNGPIYTYSWSSNAGGNIVTGGNTLSPTVNQPGLYILKVKNSTTGCENVDSVQIFKEANLPTDIVPSVENPSCRDNDGVITFESIQGGVGPFLYSINNGNSFVPNIEFANIAPGNYTLLIQDANGCEYQEQITVPKAPDPLISIDPQFSIELGDSLQLVATLGQGYPTGLIDTILWSPTEGLTFDNYSLAGLLSPTAKPFRQTEYRVTLVSEDGCQSEDKVLIRVDTEPDIYIPNAFSPWDASTDNNIVYIFSNANQVRKVHSFQIFDRWGEMVFQDKDFLPNDPAHGWDGRLRGKLMYPAVFVYWANIELIDGRKILFKGDITLVR
jgi:hypothetical protein